MSVEDEDDCVFIKEEAKPTTIVILEEKDCQDLESKSMRHVFAKCHSWDEKEVVAISCDVCSKTCSTLYGLKQHKAWFHGEGQDLHACSTCGKQFRFKALLQTHVRQYHPEQTLFQCPLCEKSYRWLSDLRAHKKVQHKGKLKMKTIVRRCRKCKKTFLSANEYERHMATFHMDLSGCTNCKEVFRTYLDKYYHQCGGKEKSSSGESRFDCGICNASFTAQSHIVGHMGLHTGEMYLACEICNIGFPDEDSLEKHNMAEHSKQAHTVESTVNQS